jgi:hypothetical protein
MNASVSIPTAPAIPATAQSRPLWCRPRIVLVLLAAVLIAMRLHTYYEPIERDAGVYACVGQLLLSGKRMYVDVPDQKPPGIHVTYAIAGSIAGFGYGMIFLLTVAASLSTLLAAYVGGSAFGKNGGLWAAAFWVLISGCLSLEANQPNSEVFINTFHAWGLALLLHACRSRGEWWRPVLIGLCFGAATFYKHIVVVIPMAICAAHILAPRPGVTRLRALLDGVIIGGTILGLWAAFAAWYAHTGQLAAMYECLVEYNRSYAGNVSANIFSSFAPHLLFPPVLWPAIPLFLLLLAGLGVAARDRKGSPALLFLAMAAGTAVAVAMPGKFWPHYYQLWLPCVTFGAAWAAVALAESARIPRLLARFGAPVALLVLAAIELPNYGKSAELWSMEKYGPVFVRGEALAKYINGRLKPEETFFLLGTEPQVYLLTHRQPPIILGTDGLFGGPMIEQATKDLAASMARDMPDLFVLFHQNYIRLQRNPGLPAARWLQEWIPAHYEPAPSDHNQHPFFLFVRKGSALQARWQADAAAQK